MASPVASHTCTLGILLFHNNLFRAQAALPCEEAQMPSAVSNLPCEEAQMPSAVAALPCEEARMPSAVSNLFKNDPNAQECDATGDAMKYN